MPATVPHDIRYVVQTSPLVSGFNWVDPGNEVTIASMDGMQL